MNDANVYESRARAAKSYRLARVLLRVCRDGYPVEELDDAHELARAKAARIAGVHVPSEATWSAATALVREWLRDDA